MTLYLGMHDGLVIVEPDDPANARTVLDGTGISAMSLDPGSPDRLFCATYDQGLLRSVDAANTWAPCDLGIDHVSSVAISPADPQIVFAGTEPSHLFRSDDGGQVWREMTSLQEVPSKSQWSFPPKPETHHARWITPHPSDARTLFLAIEAGAFLKSVDGGKSWRDRVHGGPIDTHTARIHGNRPDRLLNAAGDGYFESDDGGETWKQPEAGLPYRYCFGLAIDSADADVVVMSVAPNAGRGHGRRDRAKSSIVRREGSGDWHVVATGLPEPEGTTLSILEADPQLGGTFYALNNTGLYRSTDEGASWQRLDMPWRREYLQRRPAALAVAPSI